MLVDDALAPSANLADPVQASAALRTLQVGIPLPDDPYLAAQCVIPDFKRPLIAHLAQATGLEVEQVRRFLMMWTGATECSTALALQQAASLCFHVPHSPYVAAALRSRLAPTDRAVTDASLLLRTIYVSTQAYLSEHELICLQLFRGEAIKRTTADNALASWSLSPQLARMSGDTARWRAAGYASAWPVKGVCHIESQAIPAERIVSLYVTGVGQLDEVVVLPASFDPGRFDGSPSQALT